MRVASGQVGIFHKLAFFFVARDVHNVKIVLARSDDRYGLTFPAGRSHG